MKPQDKIQSVQPDNYLAKIVSTNGDHASFETPGQPRVVVLKMKRRVISTSPSTSVFTESVQQSVVVGVMFNRE